MLLQLFHRAVGRSAVALCVIGALGTAFTGRAHAVITTFTDRASWTAAASSGGTIQIEGFESLPTGTLPAGTNQLGLVTLDITLVGTTTTSGASINGTAPIAGLRELNLNADEAFRIYEVSFGGPISAFGFDFTGAATGGIAVLRADGQTFPFGAASNGFFGIVSTTPIASVFFADQSPGTPSEVFESDEYSFVIVPEPTAALLLVPAMLLARRRRVG